jgi:hypothetical protein
MDFLEEVEHRLNVLAGPLGFRFHGTHTRTVDYGCRDILGGFFDCPCGRTERWGMAWRKNQYTFSMDSLIERIRYGTISIEHIEKDIAEGLLPPSALEHFNELPSDR